MLECIYEYFISTKHMGHNQNNILVKNAFI